jgi:hypothetical protein
MVSVTLQVTFPNPNKTVWSRTSIDIVLRVCKGGTQDRRKNQNGCRTRMDVEIYYTVPTNLG